MLLGLLLAGLAGALVSLQNIFNSKVNEHTSSWTTTTLVLGLGFIASFTIGFVFEGMQMFHLPNMQVWYAFSGLIGIGVVTCMVSGIKLLGPTVGVSISLTSQLVTAMVWDSFGLMGLEQVPFTLKELFGVLIIIAGVILFKWNGSRVVESKAVSST
ncbi:DMT family transporter [Paenibacillus sp. N1-5-1-14]|uniref:DMT family transporter n=1 Tax=Paenibacillus radicibacter TaxID=2972488 RepID=UPI002158ADA8|nr:DMT family transporter [Paenibacillus radicibacter]MCR8645237.1 DMT family transporter [Paenibacillus radicibacter]